MISARPNRRAPAVIANATRLADQRAASSPGPREMFRSRHTHNATSSTTIGAPRREWYQPKISVPAANDSPGSIVNVRYRPSSSGEESEPAHREAPIIRARSEEHTSELQSRFDLVCRLLLEK